MRTPVELRPDIAAPGTPGNTYCEMAVYAIGPGCHVMCEKPLALNAPEARQIFDAAVRGGVKGMPMGRQDDMRRR